MIMLFIYVKLAIEKNAALNKKLDASKESITDRLARGSLQSKIQGLRWFYDAVPDSIKGEVQNALRQSRPLQNQRWEG